MDIELIEQVLVKVMGAKLHYDRFQPEALFDGKSCVIEKFNDWNAAGMVIEKMVSAGAEFNLCEAWECEFIIWSKKESMKVMYTTISDNPIEAIFECALEAMESE